MSLLVAALKREHETLKNQVLAIKQAGVMSAEGFAELQRLRQNLVAHLQHEDRDLYPRLEEAAANDEALRMLLGRYRDEMREIVGEAERFFETYSVPTQSLEFARDVAKVFSLLSNRIITEESVLYPRMEELDRIRLG